MKLLVIFIILLQEKACMGVGISDIKDRTVHEKSNTHGLRNKRFTNSIGLASSLLGIADFFYGLNQDIQDQEYNVKIRQQLQVTEEKIDELHYMIDDILDQQQWQEAATIFGNDVQRLMFLLQTLNNDLFVGENGTLIPLVDAIAWADAVVSLSSDGIAQVLSDFHDMIMGSSPLFSRTPLFTLFVQTLNNQDDDMYRQIIDFNDFTYTIQVSGYAAWATALNVNDQHWKVRDIQDMAVERLDEQQLNTDELLTELWANTCSSVVCDRNQESDEKECKLFAETELTIVGFAVVMTLWILLASTCCVCLICLYRDDS